MEDVDVKSNFIKMYVSREMCLHVDMWFSFKLPILCRSIRNIVQKNLQVNWLGDLNVIVKM